MQLFSIAVCIATAYGHMYTNHDGCDCTSTQLQNMQYIGDHLIIIKLYAIILHAQIRT